MLAELPAEGEPADGGVQAVTRYLVDEIASSPGLELHVLSFDYAARDVESREGDRYAWHRLPAHALDAFSAYRRDQAVVNELLARLRPDIIHSQGAGHPGVVATRAPYPTVVTIHGVMAEEARYAATARLRFRRWLVNQVSERYCIRRDKHTILISPYIADYYGERLKGGKTLIPNPVAPAFFDVKRREQAGKLLFAGRLLPLKGIHNLIEAMAGLPDTELVLAGSMGNRPYVDQLRSRAASLGLEERVQFRGILSESELLDELSGAAALVLPSYQESAPMVIQEAMAAGVPVVASRVGGVAYQVDDGKSGFLVEPGDVATLMSRLDTLLQDDALRSKMGLTAKQFAEAHYRAAAIGRLTLDTYAQLLA